MAPPLHHPPYLHPQPLHHRDFILIPINTRTAPRPVLSRLGRVTRKTRCHRSHTLFMVNKQPLLKPRCQTRVQQQPSTHCISRICGLTSSIPPNHSQLSSHHSTHPNGVPSPSNPFFPLLAPAQALSQSDHPPLHVQVQLPRPLALTSRSQRRSLEANLSTHNQ
jgi:hypothetical protein